MSIDHLEGRGGPGEVIAEIAQGFRNAVQRGEITPEEANLKTNAAARELHLLELAGFESGAMIPFETGSTQIKAVEREGERLKNEVSSRPPVTV